MNKRQEDKLIQMAYGEISESDELALRCELSDAEIESFVGEFRDLKESMHLLDVPEHQLSTERLRDAILSQGLEPKSGAWTWIKSLWAPAAFVAAAFAVVQVYRSSPTSTEPVVMGGSPALESTTSGPSVLDFDPTDRNSGISQNRVSMAIPSGSSETVKTKIVARGLSSRKLQRVADIENKSVAMALPAVKENLSMLAVSAISRGSASEGEEASPTPILEQPEPAPAIIIIENSPDAATGANRAVEVDSSSNVVIGG